MAYLMLTSYHIQYLRFDISVSVLRDFHKTILQFCTIAEVQNLCETALLETGKAFPSSEKYIYMSLILSFWNF